MHAIVTVMVAGPDTAVAVGGGGAAAGAAVGVRRGSAVAGTGVTVGDVGSDVVTCGSRRGAGLGVTWGTATVGCTTWLHQCSILGRRTTTATESSTAKSTSTLSSRCHQRGPYQRRGCTSSAASSPLVEASSVVGGVLISSDDDSAALRFIVVPLRLFFVSVDLASKLRDPPPGASNIAHDVEVMWPVKRG